MRYREDLTGFLFRRENNLDYYHSGSTALPIQQSAVNDVFPHTDVVTLAKQLIAVPSITPIDAGCQKILCEQLTGAGFTIEQLPFGKVSNFWATHGSGKPVFVLSGHTDVVPSGPKEKWYSDPFIPTIKDGILYGRGAADMKGALAAMTVAAIRFVNKCPQHKGTVAFIITGDEEGESINGTAKVIEHLIERGETLDYCLIGEPTSLEQLGDSIRIGRRGSLIGKIKIHGKQGHVAYPHLARNALHSSLKILHDISQIHWDNGNRYFPPTTLQLTHVKAGIADNIIPGEVHAQLDVRFSPQQTASSIYQAIHKILQAYKLDFELITDLIAEPYLTHNSPLTEQTKAAIKEICHLETHCSTSGGISDGRFIAPTGCDVVELGLCNKSIHQVNEHTCVKDMEVLSDCYFSIMHRLLN